MRHTPLIAALAVACSEAATGPVLELLTLEHWEWQSACCGLAGDSVTRGSTGADYVLLFGTDGRVTATRNDTILLETGYHVTLPPEDDLALGLITIAYDDPLPLVPGVPAVERHVAVPRDNGSLLLRNECADCYGDWEFLPRLVGAL